MLRPRNYSTMNRVIAKAVSHSVNDYYRQKKRANTYKTYNDNVNKINNTPLSASESIIASVIILIFIMFILAVSN